MTSITDIKFAVHDKSKFRTIESPVTGPSPYWDKTTEGPSYIKPENRQKPLKSSGKLENQYSKSIELVTPLLGTRYSKDVKLTDILKDDDLIRDLAIEISRRGVVFFKQQEDLTVEQQKELINKLGLLAGKPPKNGLHIHPIAPAGGVLGSDGLIDPEVSFISNRIARLYSEQQSGNAANLWHTDITFEPVGTDYTSLRLVELPPTGGDTLWANGYALFEKLSPSFRDYLETLTGTYTQPGFNELAKAKDFQLYTEERGAPENVGDELKAIHPIVRTNPVTGWKSIFAVGAHFTKINEVNPIESNLIKEYIWNTLVQSHDIQLRHHWDKYDIAIWDNRSAYHAINPDINQLGDVFRSGIRTVGIAERPYFDPKSVLQSEGLKAEREASEPADKKEEN